MDNTASVRVMKCGEEGQGRGSEGKSEARGEGESEEGGKRVRKGV